MERLLKTQPWLIFILLTVGLFMFNFTVENGTLTTLILKIIGFTILFIYPFTVGLVLNDHLPERIKLNFDFYLFNCFIWVMGYFILLIVAGGQVSGLAAIPMIYVFYAFLHFLAFPAKTLKSIELNKEASLGDYLGDFFLIVFLPIGIWFLQPRIRRIIEKEEIINEMEGRPNR
jgi:hypothetical protein